MGPLVRYGIVLILLTGCEGEESLERPERNVENEQALAVEALERRVREVQDDAQVLHRDYALAVERYEQAAKNRAVALGLSDKAQASASEAIGTYREAEVRWKYYQTLVEVAAAVDASNLEKFRSTTGIRNVKSLSCDDGMSTSAYRRQLSQRGVDIEGMDVDHIVPRSLGGADHPANYQLLTSSMNRSLGNQWDSGKCFAARGLCAAAVAISRKCGTFSGTAF